MHDEIKSIKAGKYTLVAKLYNGEFHGFVWHGGKVIENHVADSLEDAWKKICGLLYSHLSDEAHSRKDTPHTLIEVRQAFLTIDSQLSIGQRAMLRKHLDAKDRCLTATQLANAARYKRFSGANLQYGLLGAMLYGEIPRVLPTHSDGSPIMTCMIADEMDQRENADDEWIWKMRDDIAEGLTASGIVR